RRFSDEIVAVKLDGSGTVERLAQVHTNLNGIYLAEAHPVPSPDGRRVLFASNWELAGDGLLNSIQDYVLDTRQTARQFDFNRDPSSPTASGYTEVLPTDFYTPSRGFGWQVPSGGNAPTGFNNGAPNNPLLQDGNRGSDDTFVDDVPNGNYVVTVILGDTALAHYRISIKANGASVLYNLSTAAGQFFSRSFPVTVTNGHVAIELIDSGSTDHNWAINALIVHPAPVGTITWSGPTSFSADGTSTATFPGRTTLPPGSLITVATTLGRITTADADHNYAGIQVPVQADHTFSFTLRAGTGAGSATLTAQEVAGAASGTITLQLTVPARRQFEMLNPGDRPVRGYYAVYLSNLYIGARGYGWESYATSFHHAGPDPLLSDGLTGIDNTFLAQIDLSQASYTVTVHKGD